MNTELVSGQIPATHKFDSQQYYLTAEASVFVPENRIELIKGEVIQILQSF